MLCERITSAKGTNHPFIVQMHAAFEDYEHIYYLMDLHVRCGDLWSRLRHETDRRMVGCHRSQAKQWIYQLVDAIEHLHKHGVVHRDLKVRLYRWYYRILVPKKAQPWTIADKLFFSRLEAGKYFVGFAQSCSPD